MWLIYLLQNFKENNTIEQINQFKEICKLTKILNVWI